MRWKGSNDEGKLWGRYCDLRDTYVMRLPYLVLPGTPLQAWRSIWFDYLSRQLQIVMDYGSARRNGS